MSVWRLIILKSSSVPSKAWLILGALSVYSVILFEGNNVQIVKLLEITFSTMNSYTCSACFSNELRNDLVVYCVVVRGVI